MEEVVQLTKNRRIYIPLKLIFPEMHRQQDERVWARERQKVIFSSGRVASEARGRSEQENSSNKMILMIPKSSFYTCHITFNQTKYLTSMPAESLYISCCLPSSPPFKLRIKSSICMKLFFSAAWSLAVGAGQLERWTKNSIHPSPPHQMVSK